MVEQNPDVVKAYRAAVQRWHDDDLDDDYATMADALDAADALCAEIDRLRAREKRVRDLITRWWDKGDEVEALFAEKVRAALEAK